MIFGDNGDSAWHFGVSNVSSAFVKCVSATEHCRRSNPLAPEQRVRLGQLRSLFDTPRTDCVTLHVKNPEISTSNTNIARLRKHNLAADEGVWMGFVPPENFEAVHAVPFNSLILSLYAQV